MSNSNPDCKKIDILTQQGLDLLKIKAKYYGHYAEHLKVLELMKDAVSSRGTLVLLCAGRRMGKSFLLKCLETHLSSKNTLKTISFGKASNSRSNTKVLLGQPTFRDFPWE